MTFIKDFFEANKTGFIISLFVVLFGGIIITQMNGLNIGLSIICSLAACMFVSILSLSMGFVFYKEKKQ